MEAMGNGGSDRKWKIERLAACFGAGDFAAAEDLVRQLLAADPQDEEASYLLAQIVFKRGRAEEAAALMRGVLDADPMRASFHNDYGVMLASLDRLDEAAAAYGMAVALDRNNVDARFNLALALFRTGQKERARAELDEVLAARPGLGEAWALDGELLFGEGRPADAFEAFSKAIGCGLETAKIYLNLGLVLEELNRGEEAIDALQKADQIGGDQGVACFHLGNLYRDRGDKAQAEHFFRRAVALRPDFAGANNNLGLVLQERGQWEEAAECFGRALASDPRMSAAHVNLGNVRVNEGRMESAVDSFRRAIEIDPRSVDAWCNLGNTYLQLQRREEAETAIHRALELRPDFSSADFSLGILLLQRGELSEGWPHYENRWQMPGMAGKRPKFSQPEWTGEALGQRTLLVYNEQGLGDNLQFARYLPLLSRHHPKARIYFWCVPPLHRLFEFCAAAWGIEALPPVLPSGLPPFDTWIALMCCPGGWARRWRAFRPMFRTSCRRRRSSKNGGHAWGRCPTSAWGWSGSVVTTPR